MGSGFSACTGPSSVGVTESRRAGKQHVLRTSGGVLSDSCDSGISINESHRKSESCHRRVMSSHDMDSEEEEEEMVEGNDVACGTDFVMTSTPRPATPKVLSSKGPADPTSHRKDLDARRTDPPPGAGKSLRHNPSSSPNLLDHAIHEEDEDAHEGEPEDKRLRAQRPQRPKSAHFRKSRGQSHRSRTGRSRHSHPSAAGSASGEEEEEEESSTHLTSDDGEEDFGSGILTIPDETYPGGSRPGTLTTVKLGPQFQAKGDRARPRRQASEESRRVSQRRRKEKESQHDPMEWWTDEEEEEEGRRSAVEAGRESSRSGASSVTTLRPDSLGWSDSRVAKKCLQEIEQDLRAATLAISAKEEVTKEDYCHVATSLRPRFLRLLGDFKMASGELLGRLPVDCQHIVQLEEHLALQLMDLSAPHGRGGGRPPVDLGPLVTHHLQELEELCDREGSLPPRSLRPLSLPPSLQRRQQALWDESGVEDESDSTVEEDLQAGSELGSLPLPSRSGAGLRTEASGRHDSHLTKEAAMLSSLPPSGAGKGARAASLTGSMKSSSRTRSSACRPHTDTSALTGGKGSSAAEKESSVAAGAITNTHPTSAVASSSSSRCSTSKGGRKSRPDSGIVVSSCSASYSSSEATRETDTDLTTQTEWISTSLEMLEQILQVRTENHETVKSLVDAITRGSTSEQLKAHALYRWLTSQSLPYYAKCKSAKANSPTGKLRQLSEGRICYATLYQEMARAAGLKCERIEGYAKGPDYRPGTPIGNSSNSHFRHSWNAVLLGGHYHFLDAGFGALPCKFFVEHFFMTPPDEMRLSHFPRDKRWLLMTQSLSMSDFEGTLKTWPTMFAFNIRPLNMKSVLRSYDGRLSITVLLRNVAVSPQLEYMGPGTPQDADALVFNIDQEIRNMDNAETFHLNLPEEGTYYFTLMVHDLEEDEDIPAFQYRVEYSDELL